MCEDFAPRNGAARVSGERGANRALEKAAGPGLRRGICVKNLLPGTELQGLAGRGEQTAPWKSRPAGLQSRNSRPEVRARKPKTKGLRGVEREPCRPASPSHFRRARFVSQRAGPQQKNTGRQPGVFSYPINPIILAIPSDSGRFHRILPDTLSAAEALLRCPLRGWLPRSAEAPDRAGTSAGGTNRCGRSDRN